MQNLPARYSSKTEVRRPKDVAEESAATKLAATKPIATKPAATKPATVNPLPKIQLLYLL